MFLFAGSLCRGLLGLLRAVITGRFFRLPLVATLVGFGSGRSRGSSSGGSSIGATLQSGDTVGRLLAVRIGSAVSATSTTTSPAVTTTAIAPSTATTASTASTAVGLPPLLLLATLSVLAIRLLMRIELLLCAVGGLDAASTDILSLVLHVLDLGLVLQHIVTELRLILKRGELLQELLGLELNEHGALEHALVVAAETDSVDGAKGLEHLLDVDLGGWGFLAESFLCECQRVRG